MKKILLVDDQEVFRTPLADALRQRGYLVMESVDGPSALRRVESEIPDLALLDIRMPGMDGIQLIQALHSRTSTLHLPVILMTAQARREDIVAGTALGIRDFLLKSSFSLTDLIGRIQMRIDSSLPPPPPPPRLDPSVDSHTSTASSRGASSSASRPSTFPQSSGPAPVANPSQAWHGPSLDRARSRALPAPVAEILALATSPTASLAQVQEIVRRDPILVQRILSSASAAGAAAHAVAHLDDALRTLGFNGLVRTVASIPVLEPEELHSRQGQELTQLWAHGLATAVLAERIAPQPEKLQAFLQGLFHILPTLLGVQSLGESWPDIATQARREGRIGIDALALAFGSPPGVYADTILSDMRLPEAIVGPVREWHADRHKRGAKVASPSCRRIDAAATLATGMGFSWDDLSTVRPIGQEEIRTWHDPDTLPYEFAGLRRGILALHTSAGLPPPPDTSVLAGLWGPEESLYWRDTRYHSPDPVEMALSGRGVRRVDTAEEILRPGRPPGIVCADPGSPWWNQLLQCSERLLVIHCLPGSTAHPGANVRLVQAPVPLYLLHEAIAEG